MASQCQYDLEAHLDHIITFYYMPSTFYIVYDLEAQARLSLFFSKCNIAGNPMSRLKF